MMKRPCLLLASIFAIVLPFPASAESVTEIIFHHLYTHFLKEWAEAHKTDGQPSPTPPRLSASQIEALKQLAQTIDPALPEAEREQTVHRLAHAAVVPRRFDPKRPFVVSHETAAQKQAVQHLRESLAASPNESSR